MWQWKTQRPKPPPSRGAVHQGPIVELDPEPQRVAARDVDVVAVLLVVERVGRLAALRQIQRLNREAVQMERVVRAGRVRDGQLQRVAERGIARGADMHRRPEGLAGIMRALNAVDPEDVPRVRQLDVLGRDARLRAARTPPDPEEWRRPGREAAICGSPVKARSGVASADRERGTGGAGDVEMRDRNRRQAREPAAWPRALEVLRPERQHAGRRRRHGKDDVGAVAGIEKNLAAADSWKSKPLTTPPSTTASSSSRPGLRRARAESSRRRCRSASNGRTGSSRCSRSAGERPARPARSSVCAPASSAPGAAGEPARPPTLMPLVRTICPSLTAPELPPGCDIRDVAGRERTARDCRPRRAARSRRGRPASWGDPAGRAAGHPCRRAMAAWLRTSWRR